MSLFSEWQNILESQRDSAANQKFFENYLDKETDAYKAILGSNTTVLEGRFEDLAKAYGMDSLTFMAFLDGINTSLDEELDLESLTEDSEIKSTIVLDKLYYNMLAAKANWLYGLKEWDALLSMEQRADIKRKYNEDHRAVSQKIGRNDPCPCGSGKKYKKCCG